jgi:hypothetical protein
MGNPFRDRQTLLVIVLGICAVNGIFSPYLIIAKSIIVALMPEVFPLTIEWVLFFSSVFVSTATLFFSGVPAALYERLIARRPDSLAAMYIWLAGALFLSLPGLQNVEGW